METPGAEMSGLRMLVDIVWGPLDEKEATLGALVAL